MATATSEDVLIVSLTVNPIIDDIGKEAAALLPPGRRYRYSRKVVYTLENGRTVEDSVKGTTKPKMEESVQRTKEYVAKLMIRALIRNGNCVGFSTRFGIGQA